MTRSSTKSVLLIKCGQPSSTVRLKVDDYDRWFFAALSQTEIPFRLTVAHGFLGQLPKEPPGGHDAILLTGSSQSVRSGAAWMTRTAEYVRKAAEAGVPVLGICFGHQL